MKKTYLVCVKCNNNVRNSGGGQHLHENSTELDVRHGMLL